MSAREFAQLAGKGPVAHLLRHAVFCAQVGVTPPFLNSSDPAPGPLPAALATAITGIRKQIAATPVWRAALRAGVKQAKDFRTSTYCLMAFWGLMRDAEATEQLMFNAKVTQVCSGMLRQHS